MLIKGYEKNMLEKILVSEKELSDIHYERSKKAMKYINNNLIISDNNNIWMMIHW